MTASLAEPNLPKTKRGQQTRAAILDAAERVIGAEGFSAASIAGITREAGIAQGTFYIYFESKEQVFRELVLEMGRLTRENLAAAVSGTNSRLEAERAGLLAFLNFVRGRPSLYSIVEEARFVDLEAYRAYFGAFAQAYAQNLDAASAKGQLRPGNTEIRAWALMGMAKTLGERFALWDPDSDLEGIVDDVLDMIEHGLAP
ncbi:TetR family transcriptional regulator [Actibacterium mucosum KCTC 23349]|uniref:TetR family transcriptional regulator n=1 Tax=Actibacterium mucosum KCTC 23349 TaxID=1454373 RepID=A0A037ZKW6_9RHOB|nr:TetR/AcrR family transcriptional regulator [Actibacterium mucosum]KAJ55441.1 TetR family transcriptional regulator [Actibacterium mucosum KCTC 23349]